MGYGAMEITATYNAPLPDAAALELLSGVQKLGMSFCERRRIPTALPKARM